MKYKFLLFDADGTLLDFHKSEQMALLHTFEKHKIPFNEHVKEVYEIINHDLWKRFEKGEIDKHTVLYTRFVKLFEELDIQEDGIAFEDKYQKALGEGAYLLDDAYAVIKELAQEFQLYIVTNGVSATQYSRLEETGLRKFVKDVFVSEDVGYQKPQIAYFDYVFQHIPRFDKSQALIIGDSLTSDIKGGIHAGIDTCWYHTTNEKAPKEYDITYEIHDLKELIKIVKAC